MRHFFIQRQVFLFVAAWVVALAAGSHSRAEDWPQFLGPSRSGASAETIAAAFPAGGPRRVWRVEVGHGFGGPAVASNRVVLFHRRGDREILESFELKSGKSVWNQAFAASYRDDFGFDDGPRAVPTIDQGRIFAFGADGVLSCVDFSSGKPLWSVDCRREFRAEKGFFGFACSPLVTAGLVLVNVGGADGAGIVAFDVESGRMRWKATDQEASYSAPVLMEQGGLKLAVFFTRAGVVGVEPGSGGVKFEFPWRSRQHASVNASTPLIDGDRVFVSTSYETGALLLRVKPDGGVEKVWSGDDILSNHYASNVLKGGHVYGYDGRQESGARLRCVEFSTGKVAWTRESFGAGSILRAGGTLVLLLDTGELVLAEASPAKYRELARAQVLGSGTRALPALADGFLVARDKAQLICLDLRPEKH